MQCRSIKTFCCRLGYVVCRTVYRSDSSQLVSHSERVDQVCLFCCAVPVTLYTYRPSWDYCLAVCVIGLMKTCPQQTSESSFQLWTNSYSVRTAVSFKWTVNIISTRGPSTGYRWSLQSSRRWSRPSRPHAPRPQCAVHWDWNLKPKLAIMRQCTSVTDRRTLTS